VKLAVIGGAGFVGSAVVRAAARRGWTPVAVTEPLPSIAVERARMTARTIRDHAADAVVHAAAPRWGDTLSAQCAEEQALLSELVTLGLPTIVIGSAAVLAGSAPDVGGRFSERAPTVATNDYGRFKLWQEQQVMEARASGWGAAIVRLFNPLGPGMGAHLMLGRLARAIVEREQEVGVSPTIDMGSLSATRDFVHVDDAADAVIGLAGRSFAAEVVHVATGVGRTAAEIARVALSCSSRTDLVIREAPGPGAADRVVGDAGLLRALTGWRPARTVAAAVEETIAAARQRARALVSSNVHTTS
jgi:GDP-4-dehydro-6-deoxy-D-mannose reductase